MKNFIHVTRTLTILLTAILLTIAPAAATPIEWPVSQGGNGHFYEHVDVGGITWTDANIAAPLRSFMGQPGHLATITSQAEWDFVLANFPNDSTWIGLTDQIVEGDFRWVTGEPFAFSAWGVSPQEPNNAGNEDYVYYELRRSGWGWNDKRNEAFINGLGDFPLNYLVEHVPEPSSFVLAAMGLLGLGWYAWRRRR